MLARSDSRHVVVLAQSRKIFVQLLYPLLVRFDTFAFESFIQLYERQRAALLQTQGPQHIPFSVSAPHAVFAPPFSQTLLLPGHRFPVVSHSPRLAVLVLRW